MLYFIGTTFACGLAPSLCGTNWVSHWKHLNTVNLSTWSHLVSLLHTHYPAGIITFWPYNQNVAAQTKTGNVSPHVLLSSFLRSVFNHSLFPGVAHDLFFCSMPASTYCAFRELKKRYNLFPIPHTHTDALTVVFNFMFFYFSSLFPLKICWKCFRLHQETLGYLLKW